MLTDGNLAYWVLGALLLAAIIARVMVAGAWRGKTKACPVCKVRIKTAATKCRRCGGQLVG